MDSLSTSPTSPATVIAISLIFFCSFLLYSWRSRTRGLPVPPGPLGLPFVGNALNMPKSRMWEGLRDLCTKYGSVMCLKVFSQSILVLGDADAISDFLEKRSANTSDRKQTPSLLMTGHDWEFGFMPYGPKWRFYRRLFWQRFRPDALIDHRLAVRARVSTFLSKLFESPNRLREHNASSTVEMFLRLAYGVNAVEENDPIVDIAEAAFEGTREIILSGGFAIDYFPILRHYPSWLPGGSILRKFAKWKAASNRLRDVPFASHQEAAARGETSPCIVADVLVADSQQEGDGLVETTPDVARDMTAIVFVAGVESTSAVMDTLFLAMSLYPDVQKKAQSEIMNVVGRNRLPDIADHDALVYVGAVIKECLRWLPHAPLGVAHSTTEDDEFRGYFIPAGTVIMPNIWACMSDPNVYEDPEVFRPERFIRDGALDPDVRDPIEFVFGFGRRICPGRHFALELLFVTAACVLHVFDITPPLDENGVEIKIEPRMADSLASYPEDCRCTIKSGGPWAEALVTSA